MLTGGELEAGAHTLEVINPAAVRVSATSGSRPGRDRHSGGKGGSAKARTQITIGERRVRLEQGFKYHTQRLRRWNLVGHRGGSLGNGCTRGATHSSGANGWRATDWAGTGLDRTGWNGRLRALERQHP